MSDYTWTVFWHLLWDMVPLRGHMLDCDKKTYSKRKWIELKENFGKRGKVVIQGKPESMADALSQKRYPVFSMPCAVAQDRRCKRRYSSSESWCYWRLPLSLPVVTAALLEVQVYQITVYRLSEVHKMRRRLWHR